VILQDSAPWSDYRFSIADTSGREPPPSEWGSKLIAWEIFPLRQAELHLEPGEEVHVSVEIKGYRLSQPGTYFVRATRWGVWTELKEDNQKFAEVVYSNPVRFTIVP